MGALYSFLQSLIDYAGLFPPAKLTMERSVAEYEEARRSGYGWMLGRFICPASRLAELGDAASSAFPLSVIVETPVDARLWFIAARAAVESLRSFAPACLEFRLPKPTALRETLEPNIAQLAVLLGNANLRNVPTFVEFPREGRWGELLNGGIRSLSRAKMGAKIRCGGLTEDAFPTCEEIADFIAACKEHAVPCKATAGLHHPVRHRDQVSGFLMHGFLNVVGAAVLTSSMELSRELIVEILAEEDAAAFCFADGEFRWRGYKAEAAAIAAARREFFTAYGSCSFTEPIDDLQSLGILKPLRAPT